MRILLRPVAVILLCSIAASAAAAEKPGTASKTSSGMAGSAAGTEATVKAPGTKGPKVFSSTTGMAELSADECTRLGGEVTNNSDPNCKSNQRCKTTLANGDIRSVCIDEVAQ